MKTSLLILLTLYVYSVGAQIPNGGFESWDTIDGYHMPVGWNMHFPELSRISRDTISTEESYSLKIGSNFGSAWTLCTNTLFTSVKLKCPSTGSQSLYFYVRAIPVNPATIPNIIVHVKFCQGQVCYPYLWRNTGIPDAFTRVEIPLPVPMIDSLWISLEAGSYWGATDACFAPATTWFDDFIIESSSTTFTDHVIFPNPSAGYLTLGASASEFTQYILYDTLGRMLETGTVHDAQIYVSSKGVFILRLHGKCDSTLSLTAKIVIN